jgi:hypothetical protein
MKQLLPVFEGCIATSDVLFDASDASLYSSSPWPLELKRPISKVVKFL